MGKGKLEEIPSIKISKVLKSLTGLPIKATTLVNTKGEVREGVSIEALSYKGLSADIGTTEKEIFAGLSYDVLKTNNFTVDLGAYVSSKYSDIFRGEFNPELNAGISIAF